MFSLFYGVLSRICRQKAPLSSVSSRQPIRLWGQPWISRLHVYIYHKNQWNVKQRPLFPPIESRIKAVRLFEFTCEEKNSVPRWWTGTACSCHSIADLLHTRICEKEPHVQMADRGLFFSFFFLFVRWITENVVRPIQRIMKHSRVHFWDNKPSAEFYVKMF